MVESKMQFNLSTSKTGKEVTKTKLASGGGTRQDGKFI